MFALLIDCLIIIIALYVVALFASNMRGIGLAIYLISIFLLFWFYPVVFEQTRWAATPGKLALGLKVVMDTGLPVTPAASLTRNLLRYADWQPFMFGCAAAAMLLRRDFKRL